MKPRTTSETDSWKYGYHWWLLPGDGGYVYTALGYGGQRLFVVPKRGLVVVLTGWNLFGAKPLSTVEALRRILGD